MTQTADILVIGGGIAGIGAAAHLAADAGIVVVEAEDAPGHHATGRSAAIFVRNYGNAVLRALNAASAPVLDDPDDWCDGPVLSRRGEMTVATDVELPDFERYLDGAEGIAEISPREAVARFPLLRADRIAKAAIEEEASDIDVDRLLQGYARLLRRRGGRIVTGARVEGLTRTGGTWRAETARGAFEASIVVNAAGAWADTVAGMAGVEQIGLVPMRRSAVIVPVDRDVTGWAMVAGAAETWYAKPDAGKLMISPADEDPMEPHDAWPDDLVLAEGIDRFERMTTMRVTRVERSWAGLRTFAPDRTPVVGFAPDAPGFFWLAGQGGYGIQTSPALSRLTADLIAGRDPDLQGDVVSALSPERSAPVDDAGTGTGSRKGLHRRHTMPRCTPGAGGAEREHDR